MARENDLGRMFDIPLGIALQILDRGKEDEQ